MGKMPVLQEIWALHDREDETVEAAVFCGCPTPTIKIMQQLCNTEI